MLSQTSYEDRAKLHNVIYCIPYNWFGNYFCRRPNYEAGWGSYWIQISHFEDTEVFRRWNHLMLY